MGKRLVPLLAVIAMMAVTFPSTAATQSSSVVRDEYGVAHIHAADTETAFREMGRAMAEDRLWQAEILRRSATGQLAALFGPGSVPSDLQARVLFGPESRRSELFAEASPGMQSILNAYVAGINDFISETSSLSDLAPEFAGFGFAPEPWVVEDSIAVFMAVGGNFGLFGIGEELANAQLWFELVNRFGTDAPVVFGDLRWLDDPDAPTTVPEAGAEGKKGRRAQGPVTLPEVAAAAGEAFTSQQDAAEEARRRAGIPKADSASNAILIGSRLSASGAPLLLGGPQLGYSLPHVGYEIGLHGGGIDVTGMSIAGIPAVVVGVGNGYAWSLTSGGSDNTDTYQEVLNPDNPTQYLFDGAWLDMDCVVETIDVAGSTPVEAPSCRTIHGPVIFQSGLTAFTLKSATDGLELDSLEAAIDLGTAHNISSFEAGLDDIAYNFNIFYADRSGNIAYWHMGKIPIRPAGVNRFFPLDGTGNAEWEGFIPFTELPHSHNPDQGWLVNWNNKPEPGWENTATDFYQWGASHRVNTLIREATDLVPHAADLGTLNEMNRIGGFTTTSPSGMGAYVFVTSHLDEMLDAVDTSADPRLSALVEAMGEWDRLQVDENGDGLYDRPWGTIFNEWWMGLAVDVFDEVADLIDRTVAGNLLERAFKGDQAGLPLGYDYLEGENLSGAVTDALIAALDDLSAEYGSTDPDDWHQPVAVIDFEEVGAGSVPDIIWMNRGSYNHLARLRGRVEAYNVLPPGQSGNPFSPHFADQLDLYVDWEYKPMNLRRSDLPH